MSKQEYWNSREAALTSKKKTLAYIAGENGSWRVLKFLLDEMKSKGISLKNHYQTRNLFYSVLERGEIEGIRLFIDTVVNSAMLNQPLERQSAFAIHLAAKHCSVETVEYLYKQGAKTDLKDGKDRYPLFYAIERGEEELVEFFLDETHSNPITADSIYAAASLKKENIFLALIKRGADLEDFDCSTGDTALLMAIKKRDRLAFLRLIQHGTLLTQGYPKPRTPFGYSIIDSGKDRWTPFLLACSMGQQEMVETILTRNTEAKQAIVNGNNALHIASENGHEHCVQFLINQGFSSTKPNSAGKNARHLTKNYAVQAALGNPKCVQSYLRFTQELHEMIEFRDLVPILRTLDQWPPNSYFTINLKGIFFRGTLLHIALKFSNDCPGIKKMIEKMINKRGFNPGLKDAKGNSYAHLMLQNGIDPTPYQFSLIDANHKGETPLHIAAGENHLHCLSQLIGKINPAHSNQTDNNGWTPLFHAVVNNRKAHIKLLVKAGSNLEHRDKRGATPLLLACIHGNYPIIRTLVELGANINHRAGADGVTALGASLASKHEEIPLYLLFNGAKLGSLNNDGELIGHLAAAKGKNYLLRFLAEQGLSLAALNKKGFQPIHKAALRGKIKTLEFLESKGISLEAPIKEMKNNNSANQAFQGATPILLASMHGTVETVKWLLDHGANPETKSSAGWTILQSALENNPGNSMELIQLLKKKRLMDQLDQILPAIFLAIAKDYVQPLQLLYEIGVKVNSKLEQGLTGLHWACKFGALQATEFLLARGAESEVLNDDGESPLELAAGNGSPEQFQLMLERVNPPLDRQNIKGETLMHLSAKAGNLAHVMLLIDWGADFEIQDVQGLTPLHIAAEKGFKDIIVLLMICGANPDLKTSFTAFRPEDLAKPEIKELILRLRRSINQAPGNSTPVHIAVQEGNALAVGLTASHFEIDEKNALGQTALHLAVQKGSLEIIRILLEEGSDLSAVDNEGKNPLAIACLDAQNPAIAKFLLNAGAEPNSERNPQRKTRIVEFLKRVE